MGGYGFFVWGSYAMVIVIVAIEIGALRVRRRRVLSELGRELARETAPARHSS
jgi:heme exporter protein D